MSICTGMPAAESARSLAIRPVGSRPWHVATVDGGYTAWWQSPGRMVATLTGVRHEIGREMSIECRHRYFISGGSTEADEAVRAHEDGATVGHAGLCRIELRA